jgi:hypothetical protein
LGGGAGVPGGDGGRSNGGMSGESSGGTGGSGPDVCPSDPEMAGACRNQGQLCSVDDGCCVCETVPGCPDPAWTCVRPSTDAACGTTPPALMSACSSPNLECLYCSDGAPVARVCANGQWYQGTTRPCR